MHRRRKTHNLRLFQIRLVASKNTAPAHQLLVRRSSLWRRNPLSRSFLDEQPELYVRRQKGTGGSEVAAIPFSSSSRFSASCPEMFFHRILSRIHLSFSPAALGADAPPSRGTLLGSSRSSDSLDDLPFVAERLYSSRDLCKTHSEMKKQEILCQPTQRGHRFPPLPNRATRRPLLVFRRASRRVRWRACPPQSIETVSFSP